MKKEFDMSVKLPDLRNIDPWDRETISVLKSKTLHALFVHESMTNTRIGAEGCRLAVIVQEIKQGAFFTEGSSTDDHRMEHHTGLVYKRINVPSVTSKLFFPFTVVKKSTTEYVTQQMIDPCNPTYFIVATLEKSVEPACTEDHQVQGFKSRVKNFTTQWGWCEAVLEISK